VRPIQSRGWKAFDHSTIEGLKEDGLPIPFSTAVGEYLVIAG